MALDTEFLREKTYRARLCLIQVATPESIWLIDPQGALEPGPVVALLADRSVAVTVHAGKQDFEILHDLFGVVPARPFDVQLAAGFAGFGASLPYGRLVEATVGASVTKGEAYTDWCRRPLTDAQLAYAADDVRYLLAIEDRLQRDLETLGRSGWVSQELDVLARPETYATDPGDAWRRVAGRGSLAPRQTAILRELARWREQAAERRDLPRGWIVKDPTLVEIARRAPRTVSALKSIRGLNAREAERSSEAMLAAIESGKRAPTIETAPAASRAAQARARSLSGLADAVVRARCDAAGIATELVATRGELEAVLAEGETSNGRHRLLQGWRRELAGEAVLALAGGRIAVRAKDGPPYVEEIPL